MRVGGAQRLEPVGAPSGVRNWRPLAQPAIDRIRSRAYDARICASDKRQGVAAVAEALNKDELARAQIAALLLRLPDPVAAKLDPDARDEELACLRESGLLAKDWNEAETRELGRRRIQGGSRQKTNQALLNPRVAVSPVARKEVGARTTPLPGC